MGKSSAPPPPDPRVTAAAQGEMNEAQMRLNARLNRPNQTTPYGRVNWTEGEDDTWTMDQSYDPRIEGAFWRGIENADSMAELGGGISRGVANQLFGEDGNYRAFDPQHIPSGYDHVEANDIIGEVDLEGLPQLPGQDDYSADRQRVEDALYGRQTARLDPQYNTRRQELETQLANEGFARDSEGFRKAVGEFEREREQAYSGARNDSILAGGGEQSRMFADALSARGQGVGERFQSAGFYNQGAGQDFQQRFQSGQFQNAFRGQRFGEELTKRNQPTSELLSIIHGQSPNLPQFSNTAQLQGTAPPDYMGAVQNQYQGQLAAHNTRQGTKNANTGAAAGIATAAIAAF